MLAGEKMRAAVVTAPRSWRVETVERPFPQAGAVRIRLEGCGVCASNIPTWLGMPWTQYPTEPGGLGHEGWGRIDAVGEGVRGLDPGDRVAAVSYHAYAEYDIAPANAVVKLPPALDGIAFPGEALGCAVNIFRRSRPLTGETVAIIGIGFLGSVLTRLIHQAVGRVLAISRRRSSLDLATRMGAEKVIRMDQHQNIIEQVRELTEGRLCDCVIEAVGKQWPLDLAGELVRERGRVVIAGYHQDGPRQVNLQLWNWKGLDIINAHERELGAYTAGIRAAVDTITSGVLDPSSFVTHRFPLEALGAALEATRERPEGFHKAVLIYD
jgi:threonine dehydrogenase-like Zn-dependent dehydrogenase